jgi:ubiquinone/menaquinone biosynthesis C-methylase UbiE
MTPQNDRDAVREAREQWDAKAAFWDEAIGDGNQAQLVLVGPAVERLLDLKPGEVVLDLACGNGVVARRLAQLGARVVACDFSEALLARARARTTDHGDRIEYVLADATDEAQMLALGDRCFDAVVCNQALHDIADITPLLRALARLLKPDGRFVFSLPHPAFNFAGGTTVGREETETPDGISETYFVKVFNYTRVAPALATGIAGETAPHTQFHRTLSALLGGCFDAGFVLDGLLEPSYGPGHVSKRPLGWANFKDIPPFLIARLRLR